MKKLVLVCIALASVSFYGFVAENAEDKFARAVYEAVKSGKAEDIKKHIITPAEFNPMIDAATFAPEKKESMKKRLTQEYYDKRTQENFTEVQEKIKAANITWSNAIIDSVITKRELKEGMDAMRFRVYFTSNKKQYSVSASKCMNTANGWKMSNGYNFSVETPE